MKLKIRANALEQVLNHLDLEEKVEAPLKAKIEDAERWDTVLEIDVADAAGLVIKETFEEIMGETIEEAL